MKKCSACKEFKPFSEFHKNRIRYDGLTNECKVCSSRRRRAHYKKNAEQIKAKNSDWYSRTREKRQETGWRYRLRKDYNLTEDEYQRMYANQGGVCAVCGKPETAVDSQRGTLKKLAVDHDHKTGKVRGLLCLNCNLGVGYFKEDATRLRRMVEYLESA